MGLRGRNRAAAVRANRELGRVEAHLYDRNHFEIFHPWEQSRLRRQAARLAESGHTILDVGVGTGNVLAKFPPDTHRVGVDLSREMLQVARRRSPAMRLIQAQAEALPFRDGTFDVVYAYSTLHHLADAPIAIRDMTRVLRPGGTVILDHEWSFQEDGWRSLAYRSLRAILRVVAAAWYWRRPNARAYLEYRRVHWPYSADFRSVDFEIAEGGEVLPAAAETVLASAGIQVRRCHYLLEPLPMVSACQALAHLTCRSLRLGHFFIEGKWDD